MCLPASGFTVPTQPNSLSIPQLREQVRGRIIAPGDADYDDARTVFVGAIDRRPAVIVRVADATDVAHVVTLARETGMELAVRSGGHSIPGFGVSDGGIVLDLSDMKGLDVDVEGRTAWAETGLTAGEYTAAVGAHGLATGFGDTGSVGIGGVTLGGGVGYLVRKYGMTIDNLLAADVVTADGNLVRTDAEHHPDLFWAIRGGGGNFGVATRFQFRLHEVESIVGGMMVLPVTPEIVTAFFNEAAAAPEELTTIAMLMIAPPMPFLPPEVHGKIMMMALLAYSGPTDEGERAIAPLRAVATPVVDTIGPMRYPEIFQFTADAPKPKGEAARSLYLNTVDHNTAETLIEHLQAATGAIAIAQLRVLGGAMARVPDDATAFGHRQRRFMVALGTVFDQLEEAEVHETWVANFAKALDQGERGVFVSFLTDEGPERVREAYEGPNWDRLRQIKAQYDPTNLFRLNQNIPPAP
jgi:FAD/FMN-containing dehydrogenase